MAIVAIIFELIVVLVTYSSLPRHLLHLVLNSLTLVAVSSRVSALLLHPLIIEALSILDYVFWTVFIPLQHLAHIRVASVEIQTFSAHVEGLTRLGAQAYPHLCLLPHVFIIVEDRVALTIIYEASNTCLSLLLVVVCIFEFNGIHWIVNRLLKVFSC